MKCDELKSLWVYSRDIEENCDEEFVNFAKENGYEELVEKSEVDEAIAELKQKLEDVQATAYAESVDAGMRERKLKRALWLARENNAENQFLYWCARFGVESGFTKVDIRGYSVNTKRRLRTIGEWIEKWKNVKSKIRKYRGDK